ncbi:MAG: taurine dioxygenase [Bermanella sp.]|jgi:taurine dioxygenase
MASITVNPLQDDVSFGARISGVTYATLEDEEIRQQINQVFEDRGLIVFEDVEPSAEMHLAISNVFGPLKDHPVPEVARVDPNAMLGVIDMAHDPESDDVGIVEIDGKRLAQWLPWHFDHCYNNELNRAGVLRAVEIAPEGGRTGFIDGIELYQAFSPELRAAIEQQRVVYTLDLAYPRMRFGRPENFRELQVQSATTMTLERAKKMPRAIHPAVWTRKSGEKVLHVSPWMAVGIENHEDAAGDNLLRAVCHEIEQQAKPYFHQWQPKQMLIWDNWRTLHSVSGHDPKYARRMQRTTIKGDYGLGCFEGNAKGDKLLEMTV